MNFFGDLDEQTYDIGDQRYTESQYKEMILAQKNARAREKMDTEPDLNPELTLNTKPGVSVTREQAWDEQTKTLVIYAHGPLAPDGSDLSRIINRQRADGKHPLFTKVVLDHGDFVLGMNVRILMENLHFTRDHIGRFTFTFDHAAHAAKDFTPKPAPPKPEPLTWAAERLKSCEERVAFCRDNSIHCRQQDLDDRDYWHSVVQKENAAKSPEAKELEKQIAEIQKQIDAIRGTS